MRSTHTRRSRLVGLVAALTLVASCGGDGNASSKLSGTTITVGSKDLTEQMILGQMMIKLLEDSGANVQDRTGLAGTATVRRALASEQIDMYWEYTGTGWTVLLGHTPSEAPNNSQALYRHVAEQDLKKNDVKWLPPASVNNTYAIATTEKRAQELGVSDLSDYSDLAKKKPQQASMCAATDFLTRDDGWPGLQKTYGFNLPGPEVSQVTEGVVYTSVAKADPCAFGEVLATDGRIAANNLKVLEDPENFFVKYNVAPTMREEIFKQHPRLAKIFQPLIEELDTPTMQKLNAKVDVEGVLPDQVAEDFLEDRKLID